MDGRGEAGATVYNLSDGGGKETVMNASRSVRLALWGVAAAALWAAPALAQPVLMLEGSCPGFMRAEVSGARPSRSILLLFAPNQGSYTLPYHHWCGGTRLGLNWRGLRIAAAARADENGFAFFEGNAGPLACGGYLQTLNYPDASCETSNVVRIPD